MNELNGGGYSLIAHNGRYEFLYPNGCYDGDLKQVVKFAVKRLGFHFEELEDAILTMHSKNHNAAHFGMFKSLMWTYNKGEE